MVTVPKIIAHRGASAIVPENTLDAIYAGFTAGADIVEIDLQFTKDNKIVLFHDRTLDRIFPLYKAKSMSDITYDVVQTLDAGSWFHESYKHARVPLFEQMLESTSKILSKKLDFIFEIKGNNQEKLVIDVINILDDHEYSFQGGYISVRDEEMYKLISRYNSKYPIGLMQKKRTPSQILSILSNFKLKIAKKRTKLLTDEEWYLLKN
jgi:glycerophosphoryl diester phosphodiesterase